MNAPFSLALENHRGSLRVMECKQPLLNSPGGRGGGSGGGGGSVRGQRLNRSSRVSGNHIGFSLLGEFPYP